MHIYFISNFDDGDNCESFGNEDKGIIPWLLFDSNREFQAQWEAANCVMSIIACTGRVDLINSEEI